MPASRHARLTLPSVSARWMTCRRSPCTFSSRVIGRSSQSGSPATGWFALGTIGQMPLVVSGHKCQHYSGSRRPSRVRGNVAPSPATTHALAPQAPERPPEGLWFCDPRAAPPRWPPGHAARDARETVPPPSAGRKTISSGASCELRHPARPPSCRRAGAWSAPGPGLLVRDRGRSSRCRTRRSRY